MKQSRAAALAIGAVLAAAVTGGSFGPQQPRAAAWYATLRKPSYTPPGPAIAAAWGVLDILLCVTGYRLLRQASSRNRTTALGCWGGCLAGLAGFPAAFFGLRRLGPSTAPSGGMFASAAGTAVAASRIDPVAAAASMPLVLWTGFATFLSEELWRRN
ncbi:MAG TPA: TspO/MBR family protein [Rhodopila sp.]|nr:TspO/MBR family protein [Rhodopila sp.]